MPSTAITEMFQASDALINQALFGETVTYIPISTGISKSVTMRIDRGVNLGRDKSNNTALNLGASDAVSHQALGYILVSDVSNPTYLDSVLATGPGGTAEIWTVLAVIQSDSSSHTISLRDDLRPQL